MSDNDIVRFYQHWYNILFRRLLRAFGKPEDAREGAQEVLTNVIAALAISRLIEMSDQQQGRYIQTACRHFINNFKKKETTDPLGNSRLEELDALSLLSPSDNLEDLKHRVLEYIARLQDETDRRILKHRIVNGLSHDEIAELLGVTCECVRKRFSRALKELKQLVEEDT